VCYNMHTQRVLLSLRMSSSRAAQKVTAPELAQFICSCNALDAARKNNWLHALEIKLIKISTP